MVSCHKYHTEKVLPKQLSATQAYIWRIAYNSHASICGTTLILGPGIKILAMLSDLDDFEYTTTFLFPILWFQAGAAGMVFYKRHCGFVSKLATIAI